MTRPGGAGCPTAARRRSAADCEASLAALDGLPIDLYLIHAPDPRTPWRTSVRALARLETRTLSGASDSRTSTAPARRGARARADRGGPGRAQPARRPRAARRRGRALRRAGIAVIAHSPLGGPAPRAARSPATRRSRTSRTRARRDAGRGRPRLAARPLAAVVAIPGARRPDTARSAARAAGLRLDADDPTLLDRAFGGLRAPARAGTAAADAEVVLVMGIPGAGKSRVAEEYVARGYVRLNRDERGGTLRALADALDDELAAGVRRVVLDNTYLTRAARSYVIEAASRHARRGAVHLARHPARPGAGQPRRAAARPVRLASRPDELRGPRGVSRACSRRRRRCGRSASSSRRRPTRDSRPSSVSVRARRRRPNGQGRHLRRCAALRHPGWRAGARGRDPARRTSCSTGAPTARPTRSPRSARLAAAVSVRPRRRYARTPPAPRPAGAGRRCRDCRSPSRARTASTRRDRS